MNMSLEKYKVYAIHIILHVRHSWFNQKIDTHFHKFLIEIEKKKKQSWEHNQLHYSY